MDLRAVIDAWLASRVEPLSGSAPLHCVADRLANECYAELSGYGLTISDLEDAIRVSLSEYAEAHIEGETLSEVFSPQPRHPVRKSTLGFLRFA
jgi:hypothetical protein